MILEILIILFAIFAISRSYLRFRNSAESMWEFILWILIWFSIVIVVLFPEITSIPAGLLGIGRGIDFAIYVSIIFLVYSVYRIYSKIEKIEQDITKLTRDMAVKKK